MVVEPPKRIVVERDVAGSALTARLRRNLPHAPVTEVDRVPESALYDPELLEVVRFRGRFLKPCPGTRQYHCCNYQILHFGMQCNLACSYCILQAYFNQPNLRLFGNVPEMLRELEEELNSHPERLHRIGTGEFTDSLLLEPWTGLSRDLVQTFAKFPNAVLEIKSKTGFIESLGDVDHGGNVIAAWSLNAPAVRRLEEPKAASLERRLEAARSCAERGYTLAFHFDPMFYYPGWREGYGETLDRLFEAVDPSRIVYISLGAFRFMPDLRDMIRRNHPRSRIPYGEFISGLDGKRRYFRDVRVELFGFMLERIRRADPELCVYLCMESSDVWRDAFGYTPDEFGRLPAMLDRAVQKRMRVGLDCTASAPGADDRNFTVTTANDPPAHSGAGAA
jgi:spore photoproduct lyase